MMATNEVSSVVHGFDFYVLVVTLMAAVEKPSRSIYAWNAHMRPNELFIVSLSCIFIVQDQSCIGNAHHRVFLSA